MKKPARVLRVLDLGCGGSDVLRHLASKHPEKTIEYHGVDLFGFIRIGHEHFANPAKDIEYYKELLAEHQKKLAKAFPGIRVILHDEYPDKFVSDEQHAPGSYFDEVHLHMPGSHANKLAILPNVHRTLRKGGIFFAATDPGVESPAMKPKDNEEPTFYSDRDYGTTRALGVAWRKRFEDSKPAYNSRSKSANQELAKRIRGIGFEILRVSLFDYNNPARSEVEVPPGIFREEKKPANKGAARLIANWTGWGRQVKQLMILRKK